jgi:hypothetical protein
MTLQESDLPSICTFGLVPGVSNATSRMAKHATQISPQA